jgi:hypothetical protein
VRYWVERGDRYSVTVGYQDRTIVNSRGGYSTLKDGVTPSSNSRLSASWLAIITANITGASFQAGKFDRHVIQGLESPRTEIVPKAFGGRWGKRKLIPGREKFLLRKSTTTLNLPARPIIDPFWDTHQREALANIERNFVAKLAGQRI